MTTVEAFFNCKGNAEKVIEWTNWHVNGAKRPKGRMPKHLLKCLFCKNYEGEPSRVISHFRDSHFAKKLKSRVGGGTQPV